MEWIGSKLWSDLGCCGDGGFAIMEHDSASFKTNDMYVTSNTGGLGSTVILPIRSTNSGASWDASAGSFYDLGIPAILPRAFYPPLIEDQTFALYFGTNILLKSTDGSDSYSPMSPPLSSNPAPQIVGGGTAGPAASIGAWTARAHGPAPARPTRRLRRRSTRATTARHAESRPAPPAPIAPGL